LGKSNRADRKIQRRSAAVIAGAIVLETLEGRVMMSGTGLQGDYYSNMFMAGTPILTRTDPTINFVSSSGQISPSLPATQWSAKWTGQVQAQYTETYTFETVADDGVRLFVNGQELINDWQDQGPTAATGSIALVAGQKYNIEMDYYQDGGGMAAELYWSSPSTPGQFVPQSDLYTPAPPAAGAGTGLAATYYNNMTLSGTPILSRTDPVIDYQSSSGQIDPSLPSDQWSAKWVGQVEPQYSETYTFKTISDDGIRVFVNGQELINNWTDHGATTDTGSISLQAGQKYNIEVDFYQDGGGMAAQLYWSSPSTPLQIIPQADLFDGSPVTTGPITTPPVTNPVTPVPAAPTSLQATAGSTSQINLSWSDTNNDETGFTILRSADGVNYTTLASVGSNITSYQDSGLASNTQYDYQLEATNSAGASSPISAIATTQLAVPNSLASLQATAISASQINLAWSDTNNDETGFTILRATDGVNYTPLATVGSTTSSYQDSGLSSSTSYYYEVEATNAAGASSPIGSSATTQLAPPAAAASLQATAVSASQINLAWSDSHNDETGFTILRSTDGVNFASLATVGSGSGSYQDSGLSSSTTYYYEIEATNAAGASSPIAANTTTQTNPPGMLSSLVAVPNSSSQLSVFWSDNNHDETGFNILRSTDGANFTLLASVASNVTSYVDSNLPASTNYYYAVEATNAAGTASPSTVSAQTLAAPPVVVTPPGTGSGLQGAYYGNMFLAGTPILTRTDPTIDFVSSSGQIAPNLPATQWSAKWTGEVEAQYTETYTFQTVADDGVRLFVNGQEIINDWVDQAPTSAKGSIALVAGQKYSIEMDYYQDGGGMAAELYWSSPSTPGQLVPQADLYTPPAPPAGTGTGLAATYYNNMTLSGTPILSRVDPVVNYESGSGQIDPALPADQWSAKWVGQVEAQFTETYTFQTISDDGSRLYVNGQQLTNDWHDQGPTTASGTITLVAGQKYNIEMDYYQDGGGMAAQLYWSSPSTPLQIIPQADLFTGTSAGTGSGSTPPVTPAPAEPTSLQATAASTSQINLSWSDTNNDETGFTILRSTDGVNFTAISSVSSSITSYQDSGLPSSTKYYYELEATSSAGTSAPIGASATTQLALPNSLASLQATAVSASQINLAWSDTSNDQTGFTILKSTDGVNYAPLANVSSTSSSYQDTGLASSKTYYYEVEATNAAGASSPAQANATTQMSPPAPVSGLQAVPASSSQINLTWADANGDETGFNILRSTDGKNFTFLMTVAGNINNYQDGNLSAGTNYFYEIQAINAAGASAPIVASAVTFTNSTSGSTTAPVYLSAVGESPSEIDLLWVDNATDATSYVIQRSTDGQTNWTTIANPAAGMNVYYDTSLPAATTFYYRVMASGPTGLSAPTNVASGTTQVAFVGTTAPAPAQIQNFNFDSLPNQVYLNAGSLANIFYVGQQVKFGLSSNGATSYKIRDYDGNLVDQGAVTGSTLTPNVSLQGWYKLYLYGNQTSAEFGNIVGGTTFVIFNNDPSLPTAQSAIFAQLAYTEVDPTINFNWGGNSPGGSLGAQNFAVRWTGQVLAKYSETYTFTTNSDDGIQVWVNGQEIINDWATHAPTIDTGTIALQAGQRYDIMVNYFQGQGGATAQLSWSSPSQQQQIIPASNLFATSFASTPGGLTGSYYSSYGDSVPNLTAEVRDITQMGPERYMVSNAADPADAIAQLQGDINMDNALYLNYDSARNPGLLIAFPSFNPNDPAQLAGVTQIVNHFKGQVLNFEGDNEPDTTGYSGASYVPVEQAFYNAVKAGNPNALVVGPGLSSINPNQYGWYESFFGNGGGNYINAFSFHAYSTVNGDLQLGRESLSGIVQILTQFGLQNLPRWQTEQGYFADNYGTFDPRVQAQWTMLQTLLFDQYGIPKENNFLYYDISDGDWGFPVFWSNNDGGLDPVADMMRVFSEETNGTNFAQALNFGPQANNLYIGNEYTGPNKTVYAFMSADSTDGHVLLQISNGNSIQVVTGQGVSETLPVINGYVNLPVPEIPVYVNLQPGQNLSIATQNWGPDLAMESGVNIAASNPNNGTNLLNDGIFQNWYWNYNSSGNPFIMNFDNSNPATIDFDLPTTQTVDRVTVFSGIPYQLTGSLLDFEVQYLSNGQWVTAKHVVENPETFAVYSPELFSTADSFYNQQANWEIDFAPVQTSAVRIVVNQTTYGGGASQVFVKSGGEASQTPTLDLREVQIFGN
jgi:titin